MPFKQTPSQTIGPFFAYGLTPKQYGYSEIQDIASNKLDTDEALGQKISALTTCIRITPQILAFTKCIRIYIHTTVTLLF